MRSQAISRRAALGAFGCIATCTGLAGCAGLSRGDGSASAGRHDSAPDLVGRLMDTMTLEQKVSQLFIVTPEQITGVDAAVIAGDATRTALARYPVGGLCYFSANITGSDQLRDLLSGTRGLARASGVGVAPFLAVDEEGGPLVARVANSGFFEVERFDSMAEIAASEDPAKASHVGATIGSYLADIGFNLDFAPVADVLIDPSNQVIGSRSFGSDPTLVARMVAAEVGAMMDAGVVPCVKHFPGHGAAVGDSHTGAAIAERTREQIEACELLPFAAAIDAGCPMVMVGHIQMPLITDDDLPATLSPMMMGEILRKDLGFEGVVVSDSFAMGAIADRYPAADAAVRYLQAGGDMLLMPADFELAFEGVCSAVRAGELSEGRLDESVRRVLSLKERFGIIS